MSFCCNHHFVAGQFDANNWDRNKSHRSRNRSGNRDDFLQSLIGKMVKINRGGPDSLTGKLLAVKSDFLVVKTREGVVYVANRHVKSITEIGCSKSGGNRTGGNRSGNRDTDFINANNFNGVLRALHQQFVQINWGGPEKLKGFVSQVNDTTTLVVSGKEAVLVQNDHIKTIMAIDCMKSGGKKSGGNKSGGNKNDNKNDNKSGGNKSGGNRSDNTSGNRSDNTSGNRSNNTSGSRSGNKSDKSNKSNKSNKSSKSNNKR